jgi:nucleoside-diphosphate-sugar epimerase
MNDTGGNIGNIAEVLQLAKSHYFPINRAHRDFGYQPPVTHEEGPRRTVEWFYEKNC